MRQEPEPKRIELVFTVAAGDKMDALRQVLGRIDESDYNAGQGNAGITKNSDGTFTVKITYDRNPQKDS